MMRTLLWLGGLLVLTATFTGCASEENKDPNRVNNIPWNKPERWESQGPLGGMMPQNQ